MTMSLYSRLPGGFPGVPGAVELADDVGGEGVALRAGAQRGGQFQERGDRLVQGVASASMKVLSARLRALASASSVAVDPARRAACAYTSGETPCTVTAALVSVATVTAAAAMLVASAPATVVISGRRARFRPPRPRWPR